MSKFEKLGHKMIPYMLVFCVGFLLCNSTNASEFDNQESYYGVKVEMTIGGPDHGDWVVRPFKDNISIEGSFSGKSKWEPVKDSEVAEKFSTEKAIKEFLEKVGEVI